MSKKPKDADKTGKKRSSKAAMRHQKIRELALSEPSLTNAEIGERVGVTYQTVSEVMNSEETKRLLTLGEDRLKLMMTESINALQWTLENVKEFGVTGVASANARAILKSLGVLKEKVELAHTFPKPTVIKRKDGTSVELGTKQDDDSEDDNE